MRNSLTHTTPNRPPGGFTIIELAVVLIVVVLLMSVLLVSITAALGSARRSAEREMVRSFALGVEQFRNDFGFLPPLVDDQLNGGSGSLPVDEDDGVLVHPPGYLTSWSSKTLADGSTEQDGRWSAYSLSYYVVGALGREYDGVDGPGLKGVSDRDIEISGEFFRPFDRRERQRGPYVDASRLEDRIARTGSGDEALARIAINDRWGNSIRYYRWVAQGQETLIPKAAGEPSAALTGAEYAVVSLGEDGTTDTSNPDTLDQFLDADDPLYIDQDVTEDDIVEVGR